MIATEDAFLDGRLTVRQPKDGYRAGADPVFLAAAVPAKAGQSVLELGCGAGVASLCLLARVPEVRVIGVERDATACRLARENVEMNGFSAEIVQADIAALPTEVTGQSFDHVMANPPFFHRSDGSKAENPGRECGRGIGTDLSVWIDSAVRRLRPSGTLTLIQRAERLPECLAAMDDRVGRVVVLPFAPRHGRDAKLIILQCVKGARAPFRLLAPFVLHEGERHEADGESYTSAARDILRKGAALTLGN